VSRIIGLNVTTKENPMFKTDLGLRPAPAIAEAARDTGADLIVVGTRGHTAIGGLMLGSVTQRLLHIAPCALLTVPAEATTVGGDSKAAQSAVA
jgi:nucleotide-binding universal stress UspA family protein